MNAKQKKFILKKLIPFVAREHGRGFAMSTWLTRKPEGMTLFVDEVERPVPVCGTVACLGGSTQVLSIYRPRKNVYHNNVIKQLSGTLGLTPAQANGLFYHWEPNDDQGYSYSWPKTFATQFYRAKTPYGKAMVAVRLLKKVVATNGECLKSRRYDSGFVGD